jgi:Uma2 family endonuclease
MTLAEVACKRYARFTVEQFHRLCEVVPEQRLELIDGEALQVIAKGTRHTAVVHRLIAVIQPLLLRPDGSGLQLRVEAPLNLGPANEPEPDLALVARREDDYWAAHPTAAQTSLVIEVADSSLTFDCEIKQRLYAAAGISHYWVIDIQQPRLLVLLEPAEGMQEPVLQALRPAVEAMLRQLPA